MTDRDAFLRAIAIRRFETLPRLVFADWLEEHGDDQPADTKRAEYLRYACELATTKESHRPEQCCDCDRCRMVRRMTELADEGANDVYGTEPSSCHSAEKIIVEQGFPATVHVRSGLRISDRRVGPEIAKMFAGWPIKGMAAMFDEPGMSVRWGLAVTVSQHPSKNNQALITVALTPSIREPARDRYSFASPYMWVSQNEWIVLRNGAPCSREKIPDVIRKTVKRAACEKWSGRDARRSTSIDIARRRIDEAAREREEATIQRIIPPAWFAPTNPFAGSGLGTEDR